MKTTILIVAAATIFIVKLIADAGIPNSYKIGPLREYGSTGQEVGYWAEGDYVRYNEETWEYEIWSSHIQSQWHANGTRRDDDIACFFTVREGWNSVSGEGIDFPEDNYKSDQFTGQ